MLLCLLGGIKEEFVIIFLAEYKFDLRCAEFLIAHEIPSVIVELHSVNEELGWLLVGGIHLEYRVSDILSGKKVAQLRCFKQGNYLADNQYP